MFYDKESMVEMFEVSHRKKHWHHLLITSELFNSDHKTASDMHSADLDVLTTKELALMHEQWKEAIKELVHEDDAAYLINQGNIYCLIHEKNYVKFKNELHSVLFKAPSGGGSLRSSLSLLSHEETEYFLKSS